MQEPPPHDSATIFVSIPSYRDPECQYTVLDLFQKALHPERVTVGICWQLSEDGDSSCFLLDLSKYASQIRTLRIPHTEAKGPCYARALIQQRLFQSEDFYLQLDSHYRMVQHWDKELLDELPEGKAILTTYPSSYTLPDDYSPGGDDRAKLHPKPQPVVVCARDFGSDGFLRTAGKAVCKEAFGKKARKAMFYASGFAFSSSTVVREVPYDESLEELFFGEEPSMAARLWTSGWDFFAPSKVFGFHLWSRKHRPVFRENKSEERKRREAASQAKVRSMLEGGATEPCGLGTARSLSEYEAFCGVKGRELSARAKRGGFEPTAFVDGDPAAPPPENPLAAMLGMPILDVMPGKVAQAIQGLVGPELQEKAPTVDEKPPRLLRSTRSTKLLRAEDVEALNSSGLVVLDSFLERCGMPGAALAARAAALEVPLRAARLGRGEQLWSSAAVRGDEMTWLSPPEESGNGLDVLLLKLLELRSDFDELGLASTRCSIMLARYPGGGARYARHCDAHAEQPAENRRRITMVYYLNENWKPESGGCLRAHLPEAVGSALPGAKEEGGAWVLDVEPKLDRLVIFASEWLEHEVLPAYDERHAVTAWLY